MGTEAEGGGGMGGGRWDGAEGGGEVWGWRGGAEWGEAGGTWGWRGKLVEGGGREGGGSEGIVEGMARLER